MSININKYNSHEAYAVDVNRPADESCVSLVAGGVAYDGVNVILTGRQVNADSVCVIVKDNVSNKLRYIPIETYQASALDTSRYTVQTNILFGKVKGRKLKMHKSNTPPDMWAQYNRYRLDCDTTEDGGFSWAVTINGTAKSGSVNWEAGATLDSIVTQLNQGAVENLLVFSHVEGEDFIRICKGGYSISTFTLSNNTGAILTDLSLYTRIDGVQQAETHRDWQSQTVKAMFPDAPLPNANTVLYAKNGYNLSNYCGGNLARCKAYFRTDGSAIWVAESSVGRMKEEAFNSCADGTIGGADGIALYNKYNGSWDAYMAAAMVKLDDIHPAGMEYQSYDDGVACSRFLLSVTTMDFDGSYIAAFPAAANAGEATIDGQPGCMPTIHELGLIMDDSRLARINKALVAIGGTAISIQVFLWGVVEYSSTHAWLYRGSSGVLSGNYKYASRDVRPVLASLDDED